MMVSLKIYWKQQFTMGFGSCMLTANLSVRVYVCACVCMCVHVCACVYVLLPFS